MQAVGIANYKVIKGTFPELAEEAKGGMLTTFRTQPGFIRYGLADTGEGTCVAISLWETRAQADAAGPVAATWVREHLADRVELRSNQVGDLAFSKAFRQPFDRSSGHRGATASRRSERRGAHRDSSSDYLHHEHKERKTS